MPESRTACEKGYEDYLESLNDKQDALEEERLQYEYEMELNG